MYESLEIHSILIYINLHNNNAQHLPSASHMVSCLPGPLNVLTAVIVTTNSVRQGLLPYLVYRLEK